MPIEAVVLVVIAAAVLLGSFLWVASASRRRADLAREQAERDALSASEALRLARRKAEAADERARAERDEAELAGRVEPNPFHPSGGERDLRSERDVVLGDDEFDPAERTGRFRRDAPVPASEAAKARAVSAGPGGPTGA